MGKFANVRVFGSRTFGMIFFDNYCTIFFININVTKNVLMYKILNNFEIILYERYEYFLCDMLYNIDVVLYYSRSVTRD